MSRGTIPQQTGVTMIAHKMRRILWLILICIPTAASVSAQGKNPPGFVFMPGDLRLLEECAAADQQFERRALVYHDAALEEYLTDLAAAALPAQTPEKVEWQFRILRAPVERPFALPNGSIYIPSGLLARIENDDQLFGTLAREVCHVSERHAYLTNQSLGRKFMATEVAGFAAAGVILGSLIVNDARSGLFAAVSGYSRQFEEAADRAAVERMKGTGRDPAQLQRLFEIQGDVLEPAEVGNTARDRVSYLKTLLGGAKTIGGAPDAAYLDRLRPLFLQDIQLDLDTQQYRRGVAGARRIATAYPDDAVAAYWLGEAYRFLGPRTERPSNEELATWDRFAARRVPLPVVQNERASLAATSKGEATLKENLQKAEGLFRKAERLDPTFAEPYFGLGSLYAELGKKEEAIEAYRKYMELATQPYDRDRAGRRIDALASTPAGGVK